MLVNYIPTLRSIIRNLNSNTMNKSMIGYTVKKDYGPFGLDEIHEYVDATRDDFTKYTGADSPAPPFFFSKELYPMFKRIITHKGLNLNLLRMVHGQQSLKSYKAVSHDEIINIEMTIADITDTPAGELLLVKTKGSAKGKLILEAETGFVVRRPEKKGNGKTKREKYALPEFSEKDEVKFLINTVKGQEKMYAEVSNDTNPIHTSTLFAKAAGLPGRILHGVCVMAMCTNSLIDGVAGKDILKFREVSGRFSYPVIPGDTLTLVGYRTERNGLHGINFNVYSGSGKTVINKGIFSYN
ncbi:MAG TPA: MaoC/PaaZ C-terminal domain-containing protein [Spirochaetota bacterium]|nr:MaoC/PaaZ C-terminal domain-containing protein [Spirochaetota bacterium]HPS85142.1 MaoC/PaaZ C-terminal domain-containing protein [Spirochaetota bacterium]